MVYGSQNTISNNKIGTNKEGTVGIGNVFGIKVIGKNNSIHGNLISGNGVELQSYDYSAWRLDVLNGNGIILEGENNEVYGNYIGTDKDGTKAITNLRNGILVYGDTNCIGTKYNPNVGDPCVYNFVGSPPPFPNIISGNDEVKTCP